MPRPARTPLARRLGVAGAVAATAVGFGAAHLLIPPVGGAATLLARGPTLTAIGVVLDLIRLRVRHLGPLVVGHALVDGLLIGGFALSAAR